MTDYPRLLAERKKRFFDCVALRKPDMIPLGPMVDFLPARLCGHTIREIMYDHQKMSDDFVHYHEKYQPDMSQNPFRLRGFGELLDALEFQHLKWAGHGLPEDMAYQFVELELLKADEYDHFIGDMTDFMIRKYIPRICKNLAAFEKLPPFNSQISYYWGLFWPTAFQDPEVLKAVEAVRRAGEAGVKLLTAARELEKRYNALGFPPGSGAFTQVPFDTLSDVFRGTRGLMLDMRRHPEKIEAACEKLFPIMLASAINGTKASGCPIVFIPLHKCMDTFMSQAQFERFYWPQFKALLEELCARDLVPWVLVEGICNDRLNSFRDVPIGKTIWHIENSNMVKVKEAFRGRACVRGNLPVSVLVMGTPDDVRAECKKILDLMKEDGGFIFDTGVSLGDATVENIEAMFQYVREHGVY
jgi:hypothetical protein